MNYFKSLLILVLIILLGLIAKASFARNNIRSAFFDVYPDAEVTTIGTVPSQSDHCGVCHYEFTGGGPRNPYGVLLESVLPNFSSNPNGRRSAVSSIENDDPDGDGFSTLVEVTDVSTYVNTPTFPGLTPALLSNVTSVDPAEIQSHLVPSTGSDTTKYRYRSNIGEHLGRKQWHGLNSDMANPAQFQIASRISRNPDKSCLHKYCGIQRKYPLREFDQFHSH